MAVSAFSPTLWSAAVLRAFAKNCVFQGLTTGEYLGELQAVGNKVRIPTVNPVAMKTYTRGADIVYDAVDGNTTELTISQEKYFAIRADDVDAYQAKPAFLEAAVENAGLALADVVDQYVVGKMVAGAGITSDLGSDATPLQIDAAAVIGLLALIGQKLDEGNVPRDGRFVALPPWMLKKLVLSKIAKDTDNSAVLAAGEVGRYLGFRVHVSPNIPNTTGAKYKIVAGIDKATAFVSQIQKTEALRLPNTFCDAVRGLLVFESAVIRPTALAVATVNEKAEV